MEEGGRTEPSSPTTEAFVGRDGVDCRSSVSPQLFSRALHELNHTSTTISAMATPAEQQLTDLAVRVSPPHLT
jgi:hypothetical protein